MENTSTRTPKIRAAMKCPHSCTIIITPSTCATPSNKSIRLLFPSCELRCRCRRHCQSVYFFLGHSTRFAIRRKHIVHLLKSRLRRPRQHPFDYLRDSQERQPSPQKSRYCDFIRGVQCARQCPALFQRFLRQTQAREAPRGNFREIKTPEFRPRSEE